VLSDWTLETGQHVGDVRRRLPDRRLVDQQAQLVVDPLVDRQLCNSRRASRGREVVAPHPYPVMYIYCPNSHDITADIGHRIHAICMLD